MRLEAVARKATQLVDLILTTGAHVGTVRALILTGSPGWVSEAIQTVVFSGVAALLAAGGALGPGRSS